MTRKRLHTVMAVVGIAFAAGAAWWLQQSPGRAAMPAAGAPAADGGPVTVEVGRVEVVRIDDDAQAVGSLRSRQGVMLRPEVSGRIARLGFADGQRVRRGQLLVQLDDTLQQAQRQEAQAQASIARTNLQRNRELASQGFVSPSAVDQTAAVLEVAEAQVALAQAQLSRMKVIAPFDGMVGIRSVNVGDYVQDGADLVNVEDITSMWVDFRLPERFFARVKTGQAVDVTLDAMPNERFKGQVEALDSLLDANGRSLLVRARLDNPGGLLKTGMFARTRIVFATRDNALVVPEEALVPQGGKQYLVKVVDGPDGKVSQRIEARLGLRLPGKAEILEGLAVGDSVVTAGQSRLLRADGQAVRVVDVPSSGGAVPPASGAASSATARPMPAA
jgi:membrane fusion protein (multidrug efflux system)